MSYSSDGDEGDEVIVCTQACIDSGDPCCDKCIVWSTPFIPGEADTIGHDYDPNTNPFILHDDQGWTVPFTHSPLFAGPLFVNIESIRRDTSLYPFSNSFRLVFPAPLHGVRSIELVDFCMPSLLDTDIPRSNYFFLANGLVKNYAVDGAGDPLAGYEGQFAPQGTVRLYSTMERETSGAFTQGSVASFSLAKLPYESQKPVQVWERQNVRKVFFCQPEKETLAALEFCLLDNYAKPLPLQKLPLAPAPKTSEDEWTCTLMISAIKK